MRNNVFTKLKKIYRHILQIVRLKNLKRKMKLEILNQERTKEIFYGEKLYEIRKIFSYTRKELADELHLSEQLIRQFETNQITPDFIIISALKIYFMCAFLSFSENLT